MFPLYDEGRISGKPPWVTIFLILLNVILFLMTFNDLDIVVEKFGFFPVLFFEGKAIFSLFSSMFLHGGFSHLFGNMWFLWLFGDNLERYLGKVKYLIFYLLCGIGAGLVYSITASQKEFPVIGASGAISGILAGYLVCFPKNRIRALVPGFWFWHIVSLPALIYIGIWFLYQFLYMTQDPFVAYWGHIGGFVTGLVLIKVFGRKKQRIDIRV